MEEAEYFPTKKKKKKVPVRGRTEGTKIQCPNTFYLGGTRQSFSWARVNPYISQFGREEKGGHTHHHKI